MKVSELIQEIVETAECKFGIGNHENDCISVFIYPAFNEWTNEWQVCLSRPTQRQLDSGEVKVADNNTIKISEDRCGCHASAETLMGALYALFENVLDATREDFS
jgi:hypothetical protein